MIKLKTLETKKAREEKQRRNQVIMGVFIAVIMVTSIAGFALWNRPVEEGQKTEVYDNYEFIEFEGLWRTQLDIEGRDIVLNSFYLPQELENITTKGKPLLADFRKKIVYITINSASSETQQAFSEFWSTLNTFVFRIQIACPKQEANSSFCIERNWPIKSCDDADSSTAIIIINEQKAKEEEEVEEAKEIETSINYKNGCLVINGKNTEIVKASEKSIFMIFGIMN